MSQEYLCPLQHVPELGTVCQRGLACLVPVAYYGVKDLQQVQRGSPAGVPSVVSTFLQTAFKFQRFVSLFWLPAFLFQKMF